MLNDWSKYKGKSLRAGGIRFIGLDGKIKMYV